MLRHRELEAKQVREHVRDGRDDRVRGKRSKSTIPPGSLIYELESGIHTSVHALPGRCNTASFTIRVLQGLEFTTCGEVVASWQIRRTTGNASSTAARLPARMPWG